MYNQYHDVEWHAINLLCLYQLVDYVHSYNATKVVDYLLDILVGEGMCILATGDFFVSRMFPRSCLRR